MFVLAADDVTQEELKAVTRKIEQKLAKWEEKEKMIGKRKQNDTLTEENCLVSPARKRMKVREQEVCNIHKDLYEQATLNICKASVTRIVTDIEEEKNATNTEVEAGTNNQLHKCRTADSYDKVPVNKLQSPGCIEIGPYGPLAMKPDDKRNIYLGNFTDRKLHQRITLNNANSSVVISKKCIHQSLSERNRTSSTEISKKIIYRSISEKSGKSSVENSSNFGQSSEEEELEILPGVARDGSTSIVPIEKVCNVTEAVPRLAGIPDPALFVALDCEFVGVENDISALGRCSIVDYYGNVLCDIYAQPNQPITRYRTKWSGLTRGIMKKYAIPVDIALSKIERIIQGKIVVGHALRNDFSVLNISHPAEHIRDTSKCGLLTKLVTQGPSLKNMARKLLGKEIQTGRHCSIIDAQTAMELYRLVRDEWEHRLLEDIPVFEKTASEGNGVKKKRHRKKKRKMQNSTPGSFLSEENETCDRKMSIWCKNISTHGYQGIGAGNVVDCVDVSTDNLCRLGSSRCCSKCQLHKECATFHNQGNNSDTRVKSFDQGSSQDHVEACAESADDRVTPDMNICVPATQRIRYDSSCSTSSLSDINPMYFLDQDMFWPQ